MDRPLPSLPWFAFELKTPLVRLEAIELVGDVALISVFRNLLELLFDHLLIVLASSSLVEFKMVAD